MKEGILRGIKDLFFPVFCADCGKEGSWLCDDCFKNIKIKGTCENFKAVSRLDGLTALFSYGEDKIISRLIQDFKYGYVRELEKVWEKILFSNTDPGNFQNFTVMPVPLHPRRERERGFNQSKILAGILASAYDLKLDDFCLRRIKYTEQQAKLSGDSRRKNLDGAFAWKAEEPAPKSVLLVDDVYTTGATMQACAEILKKNGAEKVWGFALASG